jgi:hypothetical protein
VKCFVDAFKQDEADVWFVNENSWKKMLEVEGIDRDTEAHDQLILIGGAKALLQPHVMFTYHVVEWFAWALWLQGIQNARIGLLLTSLRFKKKKNNATGGNNQDSKEEVEPYKQPYGEDGSKEGKKIPKTFDIALYSSYTFTFSMNEKEEVVMSWNKWW